MAEVITEYRPVKIDWSVTLPVDWSVTLPENPEVEKPCELAIAIKPCRRHRIDRCPTCAELDGLDARHGMQLRKAATELDQ